MMRFKREKEPEPRPFVNCCSVSLSISCCSLPAALGLAVAAGVIWALARIGQEVRRKRMLERSAA